MEMGYTAFHLGKRGHLKNLKAPNPSYAGMLVHYPRSSCLKIHLPHNRQGMLVHAPSPLANNPKQRFVEIVLYLPIGSLNIRERPTNPLMQAHINNANAGR
jgi:hypothetical protein